jgi:hypothetical protein
MRVDKDVKLMISTFLQNLYDIVDIFIIVLATFISFGYAREYGPACSIASHVMMNRMTLYPYPLSLARCWSASCKGNGRPTKLTWSPSRNPSLIWDGISGSAGCFVFPPTFSPLNKTMLQISLTFAIYSYRPFLSLKCTPSIRRASFGIMVLGSPPTPSLQESLRLRWITVIKVSQFS